MGPAGNEAHLSIQDGGWEMTTLYRRKGVVASVLAVAIALAALVSPQTAQAGGADPYRVEETTAHDSLLVTITAGDR